MGDNKHISQKVKSLYDVLKSNGEDVGSEQEFNDWFLKPGQEGYKNRKYLWDTFNQHGADVGANYEEFAGWLGLRPASQASTSPKTGQQTLVASGAKPLGGGVQSLIESGGEEPASAVSVDTRAPYGNPAAVNAWLSSVRGQAAHGTRSFNERSANLLEHAKKDPLGRNTVKSGFKYNQKTGDFKQTYITPYGTRHTNKAEADEVSRQWREENDHSIEKQIGEAYREQERLEREIEARGKEIEQGESAVGRAMRRGVSGAIAGSLGGAVGKIVDYITNPSDYIYKRTDDTYNQLVAASNANKERIKTLEAARDKGGFWRSAINATIDPNTWLFGIPGLVDAATLYTTSKKLEKNGGDASKLTEAEKSMLDNVIANSNAQGEYGDDLGFMYRAGAVTASALPFAVEFAVTGGFSGLANAGARMGEKLAAKAAAKGITGKASQWLIKNTGVAAGDIASSIAMAQTTGAARTASDILGRHMGDATIDEQGNYTFKGGEDLATAAAKGVVSSTLEYYTEKLGGHLQLGKWLSKGAEKVGLSKLSKAINYASSNKWLEKGGVQDYPSEVLEEEANIVLNALLVGDNKFSDLWDAKTQADIWGGMAFSLGFMNAPKYANTGYQAAQYYRYKHKTDKSDAAASRQIGTEQWQELKEMIDGADNEHISDILNSEIIGNDNLNSESRKAAMDYAKNLLEMRGYNMGLLNSVRDDISDKEEDGNKVVDTSVGSSYSEGYNAADETEAATFEMEYGAARENAEQAFDEETLALLDDNPVYTLSALRSSEEFTDEALAIAVDYVNAKAARDGAEQRMADDLDSEIDAARGEVAQRINGDDFMIHGAQMKADNADGTPKRVHIISGNVSMREDGSVDAAKSSQTIVVRDAATGKVEMVSPEHIRSVDEAIDPQEEYAQAEAEARASYEQKKARVLEGRTEEPDVPGETDVPGENLQTETPQAEIKGKEEQAKNQQIEEEQGNPPQIKPQAEGENLQTEMQAEAESPIVEQAEIPVEKDKKGNVVRTLYHRVPMQRTLEDLYDGSLDQEEIDRFVENLAADAKRRLASVENENKPKIGNNKQAYLEAKKRHEDKLSDARAEVEYYDKLQKEVLRVTQRGGQQTGVAEDLGGEPLSLEELAARFASEYKVTPESLKGETGMSGNELKGFVGLVAKEENGGVSIERLGELLARSDEWAQLGGTPEMTQEARNMLIDAYMSGNPRSYVKQQRERFAQREAEHEMSEIENFAQAAFGMSAEEYIAYEEQALPAIINKYAGFDFDIYYAILQEQADARESEAEANNNNSINGNTNEQQGESNGNGGRGGILQTEGTADEQGERTSDEQETGGQGSVGNAGLQGVGTQGNVGEGERANTDDRRGGNGSLAGREQGGLAQEEVNYQLSDEVDENGRQFVLNSDGEIEFGRIGEDTGLTPAPILLSEGIITNQKTNAGYGLLHIEARHGNQIRAAGYGSVLEFIEEVAKNYEVIRKGNDRDGRKTYMLQLTDKRNNTLIVELSGDGTYWNINTAGIFKTSYGANRDVVYDRHTTDNQPAETDGASLSGEQSGTTPSTSMNAPAQSYKNGALDNTTDTGKAHKGNGNDTATPENTVVSVGKVTEKENSVQTSIANAEAETETAPSEAQKKAGNYKKGHLKIDGFDVTIENPKGSVRSGVDADGEKWEQTMNNTYGYIRGTEGVDGDHIDVFLSDNPANGDVFVVDQVNKDGTFDEHKVMYGFSTEEEARNAYLSNYEDGWTGLGAITRVSKEEFKKWVNSSHRKTKPFAEYKGVKKTESTGEAEASNRTRSAFGNLKKQASDRMLIFKEGGNYEILYEDAKKAAEILGLTVQKKDGKTFVSFPIKDLDKNLPLLIRGGTMVAITDELVNTKNQKTAETEAPGVTDSRQVGDQDAAPYTITPAQYTTKKGKALDMHLVKFSGTLTKEQQRAAKELAKAEKGWYDREQGGFMMRSEESAKQLADTILNNEDAVSDAQPVSLADTRKIVETEQQVQPTKPSGNRLVTDERYAELRDRMRKKLGGQMNIGIDPEILAIGTEMAVYHLEKGARKFTEYAKAMIADLGDAIRPYLKSFYNGARNLPEVEGGEIAADMTPYDEVQQFNVATFDKEHSNLFTTIEIVAAEQAHQKEAEQAKQEIINQRNTERRNKDEQASESTEAIANQAEAVTNKGESGNEAKKSKKKAVNLQQSGELGLFDGLFDNETNNEDGLQRNDAIRSEGVPANGNRHEQGLSRGYETGSESERQGSRGTDNKRETTGDEVDRAVRPRLSDTVTEPKNTRNNHSERGKDHAPTSVDARIEANIKAIELAKQLLESGEQATEKQMQTLRKFSGWGGLGKAFSEGTYYAPNNIAKRLRELLGEAAYQEAVMSANSAYYTPAYVVDTLWDIAEQMGFKGGNILEGSAGIGNILGQMPTYISERSDIHAIEIDGTSGGILSLLYPDAKVEVQGFEETRIANGSVDLAITNVPFVTGLRVNDTTGDKDLSKKFHNIHDFCIAKNVRKLREGGLGIFITSNGTLDNSKKLRDWIVNEGGSDFVGAFRMHNKTFGGTGVTSDIIVIRKRVNGKKSANAIDVSAISGERTAEYDTGETRKVKGQTVPVVKQLSMDYNQYFIEHPENMAGEMHFAFEKGDMFRPTSKGLYPKQDKKQEQMLAEFVQSFAAEEFGERTTDEIEVIDAMPGKKIGEVFVNDGKLYINAIGAAQPLEVNANKVKGHTKVECFEAYSAIKEALAAVLGYQITNDDNNGLKPLLAKLNKAYDDFVATYGHFNKNTAIAFLRNDVDYANVASVENYEEIGDGKGGIKQTFSKADVMKGRVVEKEKEPAPSNVKDGIVASIFKYGRIDIPYISEQLGKSEAEVKAEIIESGFGFEDPATRQVEVSYQYLSGNVREKLRQAQENNENGEFDRNIKALQEVIPMTIPAHLIDFTLGSSWIEPKLYEDYVKERTDVGVQFTAVGGTWFMHEPYLTNYEKNRAMGVTSEMLGRTVMGHTLIEAAIQNKSITVSTTKKNWDGSTDTITDKEATQACAVKIDEIRQDFKEWARQKMQSDAEMSERMERIYNDTFNNYVPMRIPDDFVPEYFGGASHKFKMRPHQGRAIVRGTMQPLLLAHEVGTGKTFTLISTAMEMRRLGTARKPMIVVQNATVGQFVASAKELYPNAKILTLEETDRSAEGRKNFYAKIRYNDWDMIVVPQSTFEFIPDSEERQMSFVQEKIEEKMLVLEKMKEADPDGKSMITRQAEREIALLEEELAGLSGETGKKRTANDEKKRAVALQNAEVKAMEMLDRRTDDVENFDDMGIDALLIDEAHEYKHLGFATAMQRGVKGVDPSYSKKSQGVFLKTQAVLEKNNGRNVIFATGTPISNTAAEIWTFMRYLMPADTMKEYGIYYFDDFVRNFGNIQQMLEFTTSGKFKENNRFAGYVNLPELVRIWSGVSDTVLTKEADDVSDKIPDMEGGKAQDLYLPQTRALRSIMKFVKAQLEEYDKMSGKEKKENSHIPLTMYGIAKAAAVDARLVQSDAEDDANSKTNEAVRQTLRSLQETAEYKGTVAIFADNYQNKESGFNLYEDIRAKLIAEGVPANEIVVMKSGMTVKKKLEIFEKVNRGEVRVILGSTFTLGTGVNIQERLHTLIHLDAPNRPMDYTQRNGRILRQGNLHKAMGKPIRILRFGVEDSLDVTAYQRLKTKGAIADSIMNGKQMMANSMTNRVLEEEEDVFGDTVAQLSGSEYAMLKNNAEKNIRKYASRKKQWEADQTYIHNAKPKVKALINDAEKRVKDNSRYLEAVRTSFPDGKLKEIVIGKHRFTTIDAMEDFFKEHNKSLLAEMKQMKDGGGVGEQKRQLTIQIGDFLFVVTTKLTRRTAREGATLFNDVERKMTYSCAELGIEDTPVRQNLLRNAIDDITNNVITGRDFSERLEAAERSKKHNEAELEQLLSREGKPFEYEEELEQAKTQYDEYAELMKKELEQKEAKYAEMDADVETAGNISNTDEDDDILYRSDDTLYRIREEAAPVNTGIGYKVFVLKNGELYPPMVANPNGEATPVGVWLNADAAPIAGQSKIGRNQVKAGGKGTQGGSGKLAYRPGWHLGVIPYALQFNRADETGERTLFPANFVWAEVEYANDVDYQEEAMSYGYNQNGKFQHSYAGLPRVPENGSYHYRTNPNPDTDPWIITGAMRIKRLLTPTEVDEMVKAAGREPQRRQEGAITDEQITALNAEISNEYRDGVGAYTDDNVSMENDPWSKMAGYNIRSKKERMAFAERERRRMVAAVTELAERLGIADDVEIVTDLSGLQGRQRRAKGIYRKSNGKITIYIPNHINVADAVATFLHEAVAHKGLRNLFGKHFDEFLDKVYANSNSEIRSAIDALARKKKLSTRTATEEYLAGLAEKTDFVHLPYNGWLQRVKTFFIEMLGKMGIKALDTTTLTDNELRFILWRSYRYMEGKDKGIIAFVEDTAMKMKLGVGYSEKGVVEGAAVANEEEDTESIDEVNKRFNKRLSELVANPDQKDRVLHLGNASGFLRAGGLLDAEILLEFDKLLRKSRSNYKNNHPFDISDANNLPLAIHNPIAIFDNTNDKESGRVILTELKKNGRNFIVVVQAKEQRRKGGVLLEINEISTLYPKEAKGVIKWLIDGNATNIDKNKALRFIEELQPLAGTTIKSEELVSAAKIVENFENQKIEGENSEEVDAEADELFREAAEVDKTKAATIYNNRIKSGMYQTYEAILDSMAGLKESMMSVLKAEGSGIKYIEDVPDSENAYLGENRLSSVNEAECEAFQRTLFDPLLREVANIAKTDKERRELTDYMMMKHGLERNAYMRKEAAKKKEETDRDFAGLTTLLGIEDVYEAEAEAQRLVEEYEAGRNTDTLWKCVKDVTQATLRKSYECGIISKDTFYKTILMYDYYIPLRGFSDKTSSEEYTYLNHSESSFNAPIRTARGRSSKADDPILQMQLMAESAILQGNRNRFVKQRFLNFAEHHPSDLISVRSVWLKYDDALEEWRPVFADINEYDTPEEALRKQEEFDERMEALAESDKEHFKKQSEHPEIPYRVVEKRDLREHQVLVKRGGIDYVLTINGSPRAAQAVNGKTNPDNVGDNAVDKVLEFCGNINRTLSMLYTTASPDFVVGNFARDCIYANTIVWAKEGAKYASKFNVNYAMLSKPGRMKLLFEKYRKGKLDMSNERERLFLMFIKNGGETGFLRMGDIDQYRDKIKKKLRDINAKIPAGEMIASAATWIGEVGRAVETQARFAAFMTSMQAGRSIGRSIWDAKEISVNFNKKGAGDKFMGGADQTKVGNVSAFTSALGRCLYVFWNAGLQGTFNNFGKTLVRNPKKTTAVMAASFALGLIVSMLGKMAGDDDGDDNGDDEETDTFGYYDISKHTRRQNLVVKILGTKSWFKLPLPIEFRAMYGMGELAGSTIFGGEPLSAGDMLAQVSQLAPIDAMEGWRALIPSLAKPAADAYVNETWYGTPIYKDTPFNKYMPEWTKAPKNTNKYLVDLAATLNEMTGGDKYSKGKIDINPAIWEYLLRQYGGGIFTVASQLTSLYSVANGSKEADWRYVPLLNRFVMSSGDHKATPGLNERYFEIMDKLKSDDNRISAIKKDYAIGQDEQRKLIGEVVNDEMYRTLKAFDEEYKARKEGLDYYQNIGDVENAKKAAREIKELKMRAVEYANKKEKEE